MADFSASDQGAAATGPSGPRASFGVRLVAFLIDFVLLAIAGQILARATSPLLANLVGIILGLAYYVYFEGSPSGQTLGKRAMNIRVVDLQTGMPIGTTRALIRYLVRYLSGLACLIGYLWMLWDTEKQTWHDKVANSAVVPTDAFPVESWPG